MKKLFTLLVILFCVQFLFAQNFVSTTPENKNVVLEEFTGIHCVFCPDGHVQAQNFHNANPGDVVLINIHSGGYAVPNANEPDFRTSFGDAIEGIANVSGYPAGTINRHQFTGLGQISGGTAMSRGNWASAGGQILAQPSCVNVAAEASLNISTRELTVDVEAYYTDNNPNPTNKINVVLLQNNVEGPQTGGAQYNPAAILPNGSYNHQHMLRHMLTGQWGDDIVNTTIGSFFQNTYTYTIPLHLNGVAYDLLNLEVAVFVAEGTREILSGNMANMTHILPIYGCTDTLACNYDVNATTNDSSCLYPTVSIDAVGVFCETYTWIDGNTYTASNNTATYTVTNTVGCDSIITLDLTITGNPTSTITQNGINLEITIADTYNWNTGETTQTITPTANGWYWCIVTDVNGCIGDTSFYEVTNIVSATNELEYIDRKLLKVVNVIGRENKETKNEPLFYIYDDGTVQKKIILE
jgi:hypothetical protein